MNILVTGGAGFIGSNFVRLMLNKYPDYKIVNYDKLTYAGNLENLKDVEENPNYVFEKGDICDAQMVREMLKKHQIQVIVNFAAETHVDRSIHDPAIFTHTNVYGTQTLLDAARQNGIERYIQISTDEVYGSLGETGFFTEKTHLSPNSPYAASKGGADLLVKAYYETYGLNVNITRCSNNYGCYHFPEKLIPLMITNALDNLPLPVYGDGSNVRDWLHVSDHVSAIDSVLHHGKPGEIYNIGGQNERTNLSIVEMIVGKLNKPKSLIKFVKDRVGHDRRYAIDPAKIERELGWAPKYTFEQGLEETIKWYVENESWWRRIKSGAYLEYYVKQYGEALHG
ncbi:dTDP-glucose 4,6-dehydratase [Marinicrinis lubricantis]|uniref:dTDP-glucose 4,6-dehydratase n=1 Tax=Marinicrinis lubricantis TaxID=2086470 RepID=A0ABW1IJV9_9BACL